MILAAGLLLSGAGRGAAHGDLHEQIAAVSALLEKDPKNAGLFLKRAELHRLHAEFADAAKDLDQAAALQPDSIELSLARGRLASATGAPESARAIMDPLLKAHPEYPEAWLIRARAYVALGRHAEAVDDYTEIARRVARPEPDVYLERATQWSLQGPTHLADALSSLQEGLTKLGSVITLELAALDLELQLKRYDDALARLDRLSAPAQRKETWLARRGAILVQAGRLDEARSAYQKAAESIAALPPQHRSTQATTDLKARIDQALASLDAGKANLGK